MKKSIIYSLLFVTIAFALPMVYLKKTQTTQQTTTMNKLDEIETNVAPENIDTAILAAGCFWCVEVALEQLPGVLNVVSGYIGGHVKNPTYQQICAKNTGHFEAVKVTFDKSVMSYEQLLEWFWKVHDPTQTNGQGNDLGEPYLSRIFTNNDEQLVQATASKQQAQANYSKPIATEILPATIFYNAENYHQDYYVLNKNKDSYCQFVIAPKLKKLGLEY